MSALSPRRPATAAEIARDLRKYVEELRREGVNQPVCMGHVLALRIADVLDRQDALAPAVEPSALTFGALREANVARLPLFKNRRGEPAHSQPDGSDWSLGEWCTAVTGELGEAANLIKKVQRGDMTLDEARAELADELADVQCYLDILAFRAGVDLGVATAEKWNRVSERVGVDLRLSAAALRSEPRPQCTCKPRVWLNPGCAVHSRKPQPTSEELREKLDAMLDAIKADTLLDQVHEEDCPDSDDLHEECRCGGNAKFIRLRAEVERHFARSQGYVPTAEDVELLNTVARYFGSSGYWSPQLLALASRLEAGIGQERTYTRDEVLRIATAAATMHRGYPAKGWDAAGAALAAVEAERSPKEEGE